IEVHGAGPAVPLCAPDLRPREMQAVAKHRREVGGGRRGHVRSATVEGEGEVHHRSAAPIALISARSTTIGATRPRYHDVPCSSSTGPTSSRTPRAAARKTSGSGARPVNTD